jgi:type I restriction enzyme S subunit
MDVKPGYKETEVGVIPEEWEVKRLGELATVKDGTHQTPKYVPSGVPFYSVEHVTSGDFANTKFISEQEHCFLTRFFRIEKGDILMTRIGSIGECKLVDWEVRASFYVSLALLKIHGEASAAFIAQYSYSAAFKREIELHSLQSAIPRKINLGPISDVRVLIPLPAEQRAIAKVLSDVDALLGALERLIAKKRDLKQAAMQQLLTGQTRLPGFHREWELKRLGEVAEMGSGGTPTSSVPAFYDGDIPWVSISDMTKGGKVIVGTDRNLTGAGFANSAAQMFQVGTVLYAMYASLGECSIAGISLCSSQAILGICPSDGLSNEFLYYYLTSIKPIVKSLGQQGTQANLNKGMVQNFQFRMPLLPEQRAISAVLTDMDAELAVLEARLAKTRALKQGMMQELLTGRSRLVVAEVAA